MPRDWDDWFVEDVVNAAKAKWGGGWHRLSDDQKLVEVQAQMLICISLQASLDRDDSAAVGRFVRHLLTAFNSWSPP